MDIGADLKPRFDDHICRNSLSGKGAHQLLPSRRHQWIGRTGPADCFRSLRRGLGRCRRSQKDDLADRGRSRHPLSDLAYSTPYRLNPSSTSSTSSAPHLPPSMVCMDQVLMRFCPELSAIKIFLSAGALMSLRRQFGIIVGPTIGGILIATYGVSTAFAVDLVSYIISLAILTSCKESATFA
jgi:hypothetical protein